MVTANLYLYPEAFEYNGIDSESDVVKKLNTLISDMSNIIKDGLGHCNKFMSTYELLGCNVYKGQTLTEFATEHLSPDQINFFYSIIGNISEEYTLAFEEAKKMCIYTPEEKEVTALLVLNAADSETDYTKYITFDEYEVVYNKSSWIKLRRQILGNHPGTVKNFLSECELYFDDLIFHSSCAESLCQDWNYLEVIPRKIVYHLSCLNDGYAEIHRLHEGQAQGINQTLADFCGKYGFDRAGSRQGDPGNKNKLTFEFKINDEGKPLHCEWHFKISSPDTNYTGQIDRGRFNPRIYFYPNYCTKTGKIYIGSIGVHL